MSLTDPLLPPNPVRAQRELANKLREQAAGRRLEATSLSAGETRVPGGTISIESPGQLITKYASGRTCTWLGPIYQGNETTRVHTGDGISVVAEQPLEWGGMRSIFTAKQSAVDGTQTVTLGQGTSYPLDAVRAFTKELTLIAGSDAGVGTVTIRADQSIILSTPESVTGQSANIRMDPTTKHILMISSAASAKLDIEDLDVDLDAVLAIRPRTWRDRCEVERDPSTTTRYVGFVADELHELGLTQFVEYDESGAPASVAYDRMAAALLPVVQDQAARITVLEERLAALADRLTTLETP